jgi:hypothetical protein
MSRGRSLPAKAPAPRIPQVVSRFPAELQFFDGHAGATAILAAPCESQINQSVLSFGRARPQVSRHGGRDIRLGSDHERFRGHLSHDFGTHGARISQQRSGNPQPTGLRFDLVNNCGATMKPGHARNPRQNRGYQSRCAAFGEHDFRVGDFQKVDNLLREYRQLAFARLTRQRTDLFEGCVSQRSSRIRRRSADKAVKLRELRRLGDLFGRLPAI